MTDAVRQIADAVLYEGHVLWPYRRSALKNRQRWTFGGVYPAAYAAANGDRSTVRAEFLVEGDAPRLDAEVRFLQVVRRQVLDGGAPVDALELGGRRYLTWDEACERSVRPGRFRIPAGRADDPPYVRSWEPLEGGVDLRMHALGPRLRRVSLTIRNTSPWAGVAREDAMRRTLASAHAVIRVRDGAFPSVVDPPEGLQEAADGCRPDGLWSFLIGEPGERSTLLASPIVLYDHPRIAPESPGDFFDGCEVDQLLVLSILGLSEAEKDEVRAGDPRAREILERTEAMGLAELRRLHGAWREV